MALGVGELAAGFLAAVPSPVVAVGRVVIDVAPRAVREEGIGAFGTADKPALACLASRIAYGVAVTPAGLARVDRAETALRVLLGDVVTDLRVRDLGDDAVVQRHDDGSIRVRLHITSREGFRSWIYGYLDHAVVVEPQGVIDDLVAELRKMADV